ncbi:hypothetical protein [Streptomyces sp. NBC_01483]|uniref:hypothetical protein n=1 Tax=Streptomyces sp. NBC_01483 TaxID=2903883 RepID=UPI002E33A117|nr:hypothetical protein [Streptomyces sp. NBC_01483]
MVFASGALRIAPVRDETTWSFLHRLDAAYGLQGTDLTARWHWANPVQRHHHGRPDGEVLLDAIAQEQLGGWCRMPAGRLARALPSWAAGPEVPATRSRSRGGDRQGPR